MFHYIVRRLFTLVPTVIFVSLVIFVIMHVLPGDVATMILMGPGGEGVARPADVAKLKLQLGLDKALPLQYIDWLRGLVTLDVGRSLWSKEFVFSEIGRRLPLTLELALLSTIISLVVAIPTGIISAIRQNTWMDYVSRIVAIIGLAMPSFWVGELIILFLVYSFGWAPPLGYVSITDDLGKNLQQLIWPALALGYILAAVVSRMTRSSLLEVLREDYVRTARAKGLHERTVVLRHALGNALLPILTIAAIQFASVLGGTVVLETVFNLPGVGRYLVDGISHRDFPVVQTLILLFALIFMLTNLVVDILYAVLDPRIRYN